MDVPGAAGWGCPGGLRGDLAGGAQPGCGDVIGTKKPAGAMDTESEHVLQQAAARCPG